MTTTAEQAFHNAVSFHEAAKRCAEVVPVSGIQEAILTQLPQICCTAFATELYLKSMILNRGGKSPESHDLFAIFTNSLNDEERELISMYYSLYTVDGESHMLDDLKINARAFISWRYAHEDGPRISHLSSLTTFAQAAYLAATSIAPEWSVHPYYHDRITADAEEYVALVVKPEAQIDLDSFVKSYLERFSTPIRTAFNFTKGEESDLLSTDPMSNFHGHSTSTIRVRWALKLRTDEPQKAVKKE